jgi:hypothetical protein
MEKDVIRRAGWLAALAAMASWGQPATTTFHNRKAWRMENDKLRVTVLPGGGHIGELTLKGGREVNPLWVPPWPSIEPGVYNRERHAAAYGADSEAATLASIMGHNVCFDYFGAPSATEFKAGLSYHGEVSTLEWKRVSAAAGELTYRADLPQSRTSLTRTLRLRGQVLHFEETAENPTSYDKPFGWIQHVTFGPPFLDAKATAFDASGTRGQQRRGGKTEDFQWPEASDKDFRRFSPAERSEAMAFVLLDPQRDVQFISALNMDYQQLVVYVFRRSDFPWLAVWEQNRSQMGPPWKGETRTRGMEFGNTRVGGTLRAYLRMPMLWDTPTFGWLDAKGKHTAKFLAAVVTIPKGFDRLREVAIAGRELILAGPGDLKVQLPLDTGLF